MTERKTENLEQIPAVKTAVVAEVIPSPPPAPVDINYPDPTWLSSILRDVSRWSGHSFVMEPSVNTKIQIFAPRRLAVPDAYEIFLASLSVINLRAVQVGKVIKIVPVTLLVSA